MEQLSKEYIEVARTEMPEHLVTINYIVELPPAWRNTECTATHGITPITATISCTKAHRRGAPLCQCARLS